MNDTTEMMFAIQPSVYCRETEFYLICSLGNGVNKKLLKAVLTNALECIERDEFVLSLEPQMITMATADE